jgi:hypothetical protein
MASHLEASAAGLAEGTVPRRVGECVSTAGELAAIIEHLLAGQRHLSATLAQLAGYVRNRGLDGALTEVLTAAAEASGYTAEALAQSGPMVQAVVDATGADTRL